MRHLVKKRHLAKTVGQFFTCILEKILAERSSLATLHILIDTELV